MKTIINVLVALILLGTLIGAEQLQINEAGRVRVETETWRALTPREFVAYKNPGEKIPLYNKKVEVVKESFFYGLELWKADTVVVYDGKAVKILNEKVVTKGGSFFLLYVPLLMLAIVIMIYDNWRVFEDVEVGNRKDGLINFIVLLITFFAFVVSIKILSETFLFGLLLFPIIFAILLTTFGLWKVKLYWILSIGFYISCGVTLFF